MDSTALTNQIIDAQTVALEAGYNACILVLSPASAKTLRVGLMMLYGMPVVIRDISEPFRIIHGCAEPVTAAPCPKPGIVAVGAVCGVNPVAFGNVYEISVTVGEARHLARFADLSSAIVAFRGLADELAKL